MKLDSIQFEEGIMSDKYNTVIEYYNVSKEDLPKSYPDAEFATLSIEYPKGETPTINNIHSMISPTRKVEYRCTDREIEYYYEDYDWTDYPLDSETLAYILSTK